MILARISITLLAAVVLTPAIRAQLVLPHQGEMLPSFEVSTVKPSGKDLGRSFHVHIWRNDNTYRTENTTLRDLIRSAFNLGSNSQLIGGPDALLDSRWNINAKMSDEDYARLEKLPRDDSFRMFPLMLQALLADRFGLKVHVETRELPIFDLILDKSGSRLQPASDQAPAPASAGSTSKLPTLTAASSATPAARPVASATTRIGRNQASMTVTDGTVAALVSTLNRQAELNGRIVVDKTGLTGTYQYSLHWSPQRLNAPTDPDVDGPSLFTALREQLGLKLESTKAPVQILVIDALSSPTPN